MRQEGGNEAKGRIHKAMTRAETEAAEKKQERQMEEAEMRSRGSPWASLRLGNSDCDGLAP